MLLFLGFLCPAASHAQASAEDNSAYVFFDAEYGLNPEVFKGRKFINLVPYKSGSPYFSNGEDGSLTFNRGSMVINGQKVSDVLLAYDVYHQEVLIRSKHPSGTSTEIVLLDELVDEFRIDGHHFIRNPFELIDGVFIEKTGSRDAEILCFFSYQKEYRLQERAGKGEMGFGELRNRKYVLVDQTLYGFKGKKSFLKCLPEQERQSSVEYIKSQPARFKNAGPAYFEALLEFISIKNAGDV